MAQGFVDVGFSQLMLLSCLILRDLTLWVWVSEWGGWWGLGGDVPTLGAPTLRRTAQSLAGRGTTSEHSPECGAPPRPGSGAWVSFPHPATRGVRHKERWSQAGQGRSGSEAGITMPGDPPEV